MFLQWLILLCAFLAAFWSTKASYVILFRHSYFCSYFESVYHESLFFYVRNILTRLSRHFWVKPVISYALFFVSDKFMLSIHDIFTDFYMNLPSEEWGIGLFVHPFVSSMHNLIPVPSELNTCSCDLLCCLISTTKLQLCSEFLRPSSTAVISNYERSWLQRTNSAEVEIGQL